MSVSRLSSALFGSVLLAATAPLVIAGTAHADDTPPPYATSYPAADCNVPPGGVKFVDDFGSAHEILADRNQINLLPRTSGQFAGDVEITLHLVNTDLGGVGPQDTQPDGLNCAITLAAYERQGDQWAYVTSSTAHLHLDKGHTGPSPDVDLQVPGVGKDKSGTLCDFQYDLYFGSTIYDGQDIAGHGPLPHFPDDNSYPPADHLILRTEGGDTVCLTTPTTPPTSTPTKTPTTPPTPTHTTKAPASASPTESASPSGSSLAHTGSSAPLYAGGALALLALGGAGLYGSRRFAGARKH